MRTRNLPRGTTSKVCTDMRNGFRSGNRSVIPTHLSLTRVKDWLRCLEWIIFTSRSQDMLLSSVPRWKPARSRKRKRIQFAQDCRKTTNAYWLYSPQETLREHLQRFAQTTTFLLSSAFLKTISVTFGSRRNCHLA